jgi:peroxiredoxin
MLAMRAAFLVAVSSIVVLAAPAARAQIGNPAPDFVARKWINSPPLTLEDLHGRAVLIEVFRTWSEESLGNVPGLSARFDKSSAKGLVVIGVTDEEPEVVAHWVRKHAPSYPVVTLKGQEFEHALGGRGGYPIEAVIDPEGTLTCSTALAEGGFESPLAAALARALAEPLWPKKLTAAIERIRDGQVGAAWAEVDDALAATPAGPGRATAEKLRAQIETLAQEVEADARRLFDEGRWFEAKRTMSTLIGKSGRPALPNAPSCAKFLADLGASADVDAELRAGPAFVAAYELELERDFSAAIESYRACAKQNARLKIGAAAQKRADDLIARGCAGYVKTCPECARNSKTCPQHADKGRKK